jgi:serine/threonine-protein kinase RIO1
MQDTTNKTQKQKTQKPIRTLSERKLIKKLKEELVTGKNPDIPKKYIGEVYALFTYKEIRENYKQGNIQFMEEHAKDCPMASCVRKYKHYKRTGKIT